MKLSKDQIRIAKSTTLYAVGIIVLLTLVRHLMGTPFCWGDALVSAGRGEMLNDLKNERLMKTFVKILGLP